MASGAAERLAVQCLCSVERWSLGGAVPRTMWYLPHACGKMDARGEEAGGNWVRSLGSDVQLCLSESEAALHRQHKQALVPLDWACGRNTYVQL